MANMLSRRAFLSRAGAVGCSLAASPFVTTASFAALPTDNRLVVIILRGGMDGLDVLRPWGDAAFAQVRPGLAAERDHALDLDSFYGVHPRMAPLLPLWRAGELAFVQAVSTPYRNKRSHFDGQDILEAGTPGLEGGAERSGWLNRMLGGMPGVDARTAYTIGIDPMLLSSGPFPINSWSPDVDVVLSAQGLSLLRVLYEADPAYGSALEQAVALAGQDGDRAIFETAGAPMMDAMQSNMHMGGATGGKRHVRVAEFAAQQLAKDARVACFSLGGWDTHRGQLSALNAPVKRLADALVTLKAGLDDAAWGRTTVLAMTEFGRTVRENGTKGTDHGTGGTMVLAGGALRGGRVLGHWPGLNEADLFQRRDLMPTGDVRHWAAWAIRSSFGLERGFLEDTVFPGVEMGKDPGLLS